MDGGSVVTGGSKAAEAARDACMRNALYDSLGTIKAHHQQTYSMMTNAAIASTIATARGTTQGSCY